MRTARSMCSQEQRYEGKEKQRSIFAAADHNRRLEMSLTTPINAQLMIKSSTGTDYPSLSIRIWMES
eukprot:3333220-Amphidinium_carterae.1